MKQLFTEGGKQKAISESLDFVKRHNEASRLRKLRDYKLPVSPTPSKKSANVVYIILDDKDEVIYVGQTYILNYRLKAHSYTKKWWSKASRVSIIECVDRETARRIEKEQIELLKPYGQII